MIKFNIEKYKNRLSERNILFNKLSIEEIKNNINKLKENSDIDSRIELFYKKRELNSILLFMNKNKKVVTREESDKIINNNISWMNEIINLLKEKKNILVSKLNQSLNELERVELQLEIHNLDANLDSKHEFIKQYNKRKNIYNLNKKAPN